MPYSELSERDLAEVKSFGVELYNIKQVAAILKVTERTVMTYIGKGRIKAQKIGGKWMFTREAIESFMRGD